MLKSLEYVLSPIKKVFCNKLGCVAKHLPVYQSEAPLDPTLTEGS
jgi:hypothetical protein